MIASQIIHNTEVPAISASSDRSLVKVENDDGRLRLRFTHAGKRYAITVRLPDSKINRLVAQQKAAQIELDIASGNFDPTLSKYKPAKATSVKPKQVTVAEVFQEFMETQLKTKELHTGSLCRYRATLKHLERYFLIKSAESISHTDAEGFA